MDSQEGMIRHLVRIGVLAAGLCAPGTVGGQGDRYIDNFEDGGFSWSGTTTPVVIQQDNLHAVQVMGGERQIELAYGYLEFSGEVAVDTAEGGRFRFAPTSPGYVRLMYGADTPLNVDLIGPRYAAFLFVFPKTPDRGAPAAFRVADDAVEESVSLDLRGLQGGGPMLVPFTRFSQVDLSRVQRIELDVYRMAPDTELVISEMKTVRALFEPIGFARTADPSALQLTWTSWYLYAYQVQSRSGTGPWTHYGQMIPGTDGVTSVPIPLPQADSHAQFRVWRTTVQFWAP